MRNNFFLHSWWVLGLRGLFAILFGAFTLFWPGITLLMLIAGFAAYALCSGIVSMVGAIRQRRAGDDWWLMLLVGLVNIGAAIVALVQPGLMLLVIVLTMGANALITGVLDIAAAVRLRKIIQREWLLGLSGIASVLFGILVFMFPVVGALSILLMVSVYALITGVLLLGIAFRARSLARGGTAPEHERRVNPERRITPDRRIASAH